MRDRLSGWNRVPFYNKMLLGLQEGKPGSVGTVVCAELWGGRPCAPPGEPRVMRDTELMTRTGEHVGAASFRRPRHARLALFPVQSLGSEVRTLAVGCGFVLLGG